MKINSLRSFAMASETMVHCNWWATFSVGCDHSLYMWALSGGFTSHCPLRVFTQFEWRQLHYIPAAPAYFIHLYVEAIAVLGRCGSSRGIPCWKIIITCNSLNCNEVLKNINKAKITSTMLNKYDVIFASFSLKKKSTKTSKVYLNIWLCDLFSFLLFQNVWQLIQICNIIQQGHVHLVLTEKDFELIRNKLCGCKMVTFVVC